MFECYFFKWFISSVFEKRCEITLLFSFGQIFEQEFTKLMHFLSFCQLRMA